MAHSVSSPADKDHAAIEKLMIHGDIGPCEQVVHLQSVESSEISGLEHLGRQLGLLSGGFCYFEPENLLTVPLK